MGFVGYTITQKCQNDSRCRCFLGGDGPNKRDHHGKSSEVNHKIVQIYPDLMTDLV